jgi:hypothetical protein
MMNLAVTTKLVTITEPAMINQAGGVEVRAMRVSPKQNLKLLTEKELGM